MALERAIAAAALSLSIMTGCAGANPLRAAEGGRVAAAGQSAFPNQDELTKIAHRVGRMGEGEFASAYAGVGIDVHRDRVDVWAKESTAFRAAVDAMPWGGRVSWHQAPHAAAELEPTFQRILRDQDHWRQQGLPVVLAAVRHQGTCVEVGTPDPRRAEQEFPRRYPGVPMCFLTQPDTGNPFQERRP